MKKAGNRFNTSNLEDKLNFNFTLINSGIKYKPPWDLFIKIVCRSKNYTCDQKNRKNRTK